MTARTGQPSGAAGARGAAARRGRRGRGRRRCRGRRAPSSGGGRNAPPHLRARGGLGRPGGWCRPGSGPQGGPGASAPWSPQGGAPAAALRPPVRRPVLRRPRPLRLGPQNGAPPYGAPGPYASGQQGFATGGYPPGGDTWRASSTRRPGGRPRRDERPAGRLGSGWPGRPAAEVERGKIVAIVAGIAVLLLVVAVGVVVLVNQSSGRRTPTATPQVPGDHHCGPPPRRRAPRRRSRRASRRSRRSSRTSRARTVPGGEPARRAHSPGSSPTESYVCDFSSAAPGARVIFARWADAAGAQACYQDIAEPRPAHRELRGVAVRRREQGPLYTAQSNGTVYSDRHLPRV